MINHKVCSACKATKPFDEFYKRENSSDGLRNDCKSCHKARSLRGHYENRDDRNKKKREAHHLKVMQNPSFYVELYKEKRDYILSKSAESYKRNRETAKARAQRWASENRGKSNAIKKAYKAAKSRACPQWARDDKVLRAQMDEIYERAYRISEETGVRHHVDHIIPLRGKTVSGLHVPWNLQVLPGSENCSKSNKLLEGV